MDAAEPDPGLDPDTAFNRQWASSILQMAIERVREDCQKRSMQNHWTAFELRVLRPAIGLTKPPAIEQIKDIVSAKDTQQVSHMIQSVKRKMESAVREIVASTLENQSELEQETSSVLWHTRLG